MNKKYNGFTLSQVLITLAIIGVVAAMTLPTVISNYRKHVVENNLKKYYTMLNQLLTNSEANNGPAADWDWPAYGKNPNREFTIPFFNKYFAPYLKIIDKKTTFYPDPYIPKTSEGRKMQINSYASNWRILPDGGVITFASYNYAGSLGQFYIILPNANKNNLMYGRDVFTFSMNYKEVDNVTTNSITINNKQIIIEPSVWNNRLGCKDIETNRNYHINTCKDSGYPDSTLVACTKLIYCNNWKIPNDYPIKF